MSLTTVLLHMEADAPNETRLRYATDLAGEIEAHLLGFSALALRPVHVSELGPANDNAYANQLSIRNRARLSEIKRSFFAMAGEALNSEWIQSEEMPGSALMRAARNADLIVTGTPFGASTPDHYRSVDPGDLVCGAGRPVLLLADDGVFHPFDTVVIGWKDTTEARRAVAFSLPLLMLARRVIVVTVSEDEGPAARDGPEDVMRLLLRHEIDATTHIVPGSGPAEFIEFVRREKAGLVVAGAYGHSRLRERVFGGFTRALLERSDITRLMAG